MLSLSTSRRVTTDEGIEIAAQSLPAVLQAKSITDESSPSFCRKILAIANFSCDKLRLLCLKFKEGVASSCLISNVEKMPGVSFLNYC